MALAFTTAQAADRKIYSIGLCSNLVETLKLLKVHTQLCKPDGSEKFVGEVLALVQNHCGYLKASQIKRATNEIDSLMTRESQNGNKYFCTWSDFEADAKLNKPAWQLDRDDSGKLWSDK